MEYYFVLKSTDSEAFYPGNTINRFKTKLYKPLTLRGKWKVALTELHFLDAVHTELSDSILIQSPLCESITIIEGNMYLPVLRHIVRKKKEKSWIFDNPTYLPVNQTFLESIEIYITQGNNVPASFQSGTAVCTVHILQSSDQEES